MYNMRLLEQLLEKCKYTMKNRYLSVIMLKCIEVYMNRNKYSDINGFK